MAVCSIVNNYKTTHKTERNCRNYRELQLKTLSINYMAVLNFSTEASKKCRINKKPTIQESQADIQKKNNRSPYGDLVP